MDPQSLFERLLKAEDETDVDDILAEAGYFNDDKGTWQPFGNYENNFNLIGNQQADPTAAEVEKIINAIDAVLMAECFKRNIDPQGPEAPPSMTKAVESFFNVRYGRLENLTAKEQTDLADKIHVVAVGAKKSPSYLIIDRGEGQTPATFPNTFLSLNRSNKMRIPFVQGKFNSGGTGILQFCGKRNYQLVASKRHPDAPVDPTDTTAGLWGFTLVRRLLPVGGIKASSYVYLAPNGVIPSFEADAINVLPGAGSSNNPPRPYTVGLSFGTCVKLYNYRWKAKSLATTEARYELERYLHTPCLPFRITETRDEYKANSYSTTLSGVWAGVNADVGGDSNKVEKGFPADAELNLPNIGPLPYQIVLFREECNPRHFPHGVFFTVNGQVHGQLGANFISTSLKFDYLSQYMLVSIDCTAMNPQVREDFFMASRDRLRRNEVYDEIQQHLKEDLKSHPGLRAHNAIRKQQDIEKALSDDKQTVDFFQDLIKRDPALSTLLGAGGRLVTSTGPTDNPTFDGRKFPTFFRLIKEPKEGLVKNCPLNKTVRIEFETDAENNYFERADSRGEIIFDPPNLCVSSSLWNGKYTTRFQLPWDANINDVLGVMVTISDVERESKGSPFISKFTLKGAPESEVVTQPGGHPSNGSKSTANGKVTAPALALPKIREIRKDEWDKPLLKFNEFSAIKITHDDDEGFIFHLNVENAYLLTELTRARDEEKPLIKFWFIWGLALCALGMLQDEKRRSKDHDASHESESQLDDGDFEDLDRIGRYCTGLARVIVPIVRQLYRGPQMAKAAAS